VSDPGLTAGEAARQLGVAVTTLRSWHRRYGLGPSHFEPGRHRRYTAADMARLEVMRRLTSAGLPPAQAARTALATVQPPIDPIPPVRDGGGYAIPVGRAGSAARGLSRAAMRLDAATMVEILTTSLRRKGVVPTWDGLIRPVLGGVGYRHERTGRLVEVEHLLSRSVSEALATVPRPGDGTPTRTLLACADDEQHTLPLEALAAALAERGTGSRLLGARVPPHALDRAIRQTGPLAVLVWSQTAETGGAEQLSRLVQTRPRPVLVAAAGPGWAGELPPDVATPTGLTEALDLTMAAVQIGAR
jgi:MerR family transcriptional regulator, light-induced transcriptional regulator